eukprot:gene22811-29982_t
MQSSTGEDSIDYFNLQYTTMTRVSPSYKVYHNMWMHNSRWYALLPSDNSSTVDLEEGLSPNIAVLRLPVEDLRVFGENLRVTHIKGNSLLVDFPFQAYHDHLGHWLEIMVPIFSVLYEDDWLNHTQGDSGSIDTVLFPNLSKYYLNSFFKSILAVALAPGTATRSHPEIMDYADLDKVMQMGWIFMDNLVLVSDRYTHPQRKTGFPNPEHGDLWRYDGCDRWISPTFVSGFTNPVHGLEFRDATYIGEDLQAPPAWEAGTPPALPMTITFLQHGTAGEAAIENPEEHGTAGEATIEKPEEVMSMLHEVADEFGMTATTQKLTPQAPFSLHLKTVMSMLHEVADEFGMTATTQKLTPQAPFSLHLDTVMSMLHELADEFGMTATTQKLTPQEPFSSHWSRSYPLHPPHTLLLAPEHDCIHLTSHEPNHSHMQVISMPHELADEFGMTATTQKLTPQAPFSSHLDTVMSMLHELADEFGMTATTQKLTPQAPFSSHLDTVSSTGILVARHSSLLASAVFLPPGAAVMELLPYKWEWHKISMLYYNVTQSIGDIHHWAWRPMTDEYCKYADKQGPRYRDWFPSECHAKECLQVFDKAGLIVDTDALRTLLRSKIPGMLAGKSVEELSEPWPIAV